MVFQPGSPSGNPARLVDAETDTEHHIYTREAPSQFDDFRPLGQAMPCNQRLCLDCIICQFPPVALDPTKLVSEFDSADVYATVGAKYKTVQIGSGVLQLCVDRRPMLDYTPPWIDNAAFWKHRIFIGIVHTFWSIPCEVWRVDVLQHWVPKSAPAAVSACSYCGCLVALKAFPPPLGKVKRKRH